MYTDIKYIHITQSYLKTRKNMCTKTAPTVNLTVVVVKGLMYLFPVKCRWYPCRDFGKKVFERASDGVFIIAPLSHLIKIATEYHELIFRDLVRSI